MFGFAILKSYNPAMLMIRPARQEDAPTIKLVIYSVADNIFGSDERRTGYRVRHAAQTWRGNRKNQAHVAAGELSRPGHRISSHHTTF